MVPRRKYCILFYQMKSGKIHWNIWRWSSQILAGHIICPFDLHQLVEQCLIHMVIQTICRCKYDKANTNTCHAMWLVRVVLFKDCPASLNVCFTLPLKKKATFSTKALATDPSHKHSWTADFDFAFDFEEAFIRNPSNQKKTLVLPVEPAWRTSPAVPAWRLRFIDGFQFTCSARSM